MAEESAAPVAAESTTEELQEKKVKKAFLEKFRLTKKKTNESADEAKEETEATPDDVAERIYRQLAEIKGNDYIVIRLRKRNFLVLAGILVGIMWLLLFSLNILGLFGLLVSAVALRPHFTRSLGLAGGITGLFGLIVLPLLLLAWNWFFIAFHQVLFPQGNWAFPPDSTLIRLFPEPLWVEAFTAAALGILAVGLCYLGLGRLVSRR